MWLPLDLLDMIWELGLPEIVLSRTRMDATSLQTLNEVKSKLGVSNTIGLGIHGDGCRTISIAPNAVLRLP